MATRGGCGGSRREWGWQAPGRGHSSAYCREGRRFLMLRLPPFQYRAPRSLNEAAQMLSQEGERAMLVAGGTDLYPNMKRRQFTPEVVIGLRGIPDLKHIHGSAKQGLRIGACATLTALAEHPLLVE